MSQTFQENSEKQRFPRLARKVGEQHKFMIASIILLVILSIALFYDISSLGIAPLLGLMAVNQLYILYNAMDML